MGFTEPFLVNPPKSKRSRFGFKGLLSRLGNPFRKRHKRTPLKRGTLKHFKVRKNPLADLMIMNAPKRKTHRRTTLKRGTRTPKKVREITARKAGRGEIRMTKRRRHRRNAPKKHRLSLVGRRVSRRSRLAPRHRGRLINPALAIGGLVPSMDVLQDVAGITVGFAVVKLVPTYLYPAIGFVKPAGILGTVTDVVLVVAVSSLAGFVLKKPAIRKALLIGGLVAIAIDVLEQTGVLSDAGTMGYILPPSQLSSYQIPAQMAGESEYEDTRR